MTEERKKFLEQRLKQLLEQTEDEKNKDLLKLELSYLKKELRTIPKL